MEEPRNKVLQAFCLTISVKAMPSACEAPTTTLPKALDAASTASSRVQQAFFIVDDHPIRSMEVPLTDHVTNLHCLVLLVVKLDRAIQSRQVRATRAGQSWVDGVHSTLSRAMKDKQPISLAQSEGIFCTLQQLMASGDIAMDGTWRTWLSSEFKGILRLGSFGHAPHQSSMQCRRKCLVLDLDRTMWFRSFLPIATADLTATFEMTHSKVKRTVHVSVRPGAQQLVQSLAPHYDIVVFTASDRKMTDHLVDRIDPGRHIQCRLYRDSCSLSSETGNVIKDLRLLGRPPQHVVLVDDNPHVCGAQSLDNLLTCTEYWGDKKDKELFGITSALQKWHAVEDIRPHLHDLRVSRQSDRGAVIAKASAA